MFNKTKKVPQLTRKESLDAVPIKNPNLKWDKGQKGEVRIDLPLKSNWWVKLLSKVFSAPKSKTLSLDEIGTKVWDLCDGKKNVEQIIQILCRDLNMNRREIETSLTTYLKQLGSRGLIGLIVAGKPGDKKFEGFQPVNVKEAR